MKAPLVAAVVAGALAGAVVATALVVTLGSPGERATTPALVPDRPAAATGTALEHELDALRAQNVELLARVTDLEDRVRDGEAVRRALAEPSEDSGPQGDALELAAALHDPGAPLPPKLIEGVTSALETIRANEERERSERRVAAYNERLDEMLGSLDRDLGLTTDQSRNLRTHLESYNVRRTELFESARADGFQSVRQAFHDLREESEADLARILDPMQLEKFHDLELDRGFDRFGRGRDRPGSDG